MSIDQKDIQVGLASRRGFSDTFSALRHRNFRIFWSGQVVSLVGSWMQSAAQGWLVLMLATAHFGKAEAPFYIGLVGALGSLPMFAFCLFAGVFADRMDRRRILIATQSALMLLALGLAVLTGSEVVKFWHVVVFSMLSGLVMAFDMPTRQAFVKDISSPRDLLNAIALNSTIFNLARILGPAVAGPLIQIPAIGISGALYINAASFLAVLISLSQIRLTPQVREKSDANLWQHLGEGFRFVAGHQLIRMLLVMMAVYSIFGFSYAVLMSVIATQTLQQGAAGYGALMSASGVGAFIGAIWLAARARYARKGQLLIYAGVLSGISIVAFSFSRNFLLSMLILPFVGAGLVVASACINSIIQEVTPDALRGRVVSMWAFIFAGFTPIGSLYAGVVARVTSADMAIMLGGVACLIMMLVIILKYRAVLWDTA